MNIAIIHFKEPRTAHTIYDHLYSFQKHSRHHITYFHARNSRLSKPILEKFDVLVIHYTIAMFNESTFPPMLRRLLHNLTIKKVVFIQDEYRQINEIIENLNYIKADLLFTCFPPSEIEKVYSSEKLPNLIKVNTLTGFVPEKLLKLKKISYKKKIFDVVYRSRRVPTWLGELGREKWRIAERFILDGTKFSLRQDISVEEFDRIYGKKWIKFLSRSKAAIGVESGASVLDFDGEIQRKVEEYEKSNPWASFETVKNIFFSHLEGKVFLNQISPRCFECAALKTLMILYEGNYSGILIPWRHYVPLKKDHSNMEEVVRILRDEQEWKRITDHAYEEIACNPEYSYKNFVRTFEHHVESLFSKTHVSPQKKIPLSLLLTKMHALPTLTIFRLSLQRYTYMFVFLILGALPLPQRQKKRIQYHLKRAVLNPLRSFINKISIIKTCGISLKIRNLQKILKGNFFNIFLDKEFFQEAFLLSTIFSYSKKTKKMGLPPLLFLHNSVTEIVLNATEKTDKNTLINTPKDILATSKPIRIVSDNSLGLPKKLRNLNISLKHGQEIIELMK